MFGNYILENIFQKVISVLFLALVKITLVDAFMSIYCYCISLRESVYLHVNMIIYSDSALQQTLNTIIIGHANFIMLGVLAMCVVY